MTISPHPDEYTVSSTATTVKASNLDLATAKRIMADDSSRSRDAELLRLRAEIRVIRAENRAIRAENRAIRAANRQRPVGEVLAEVDVAQMRDIQETDSRDTPSTLTQEEAADGRDAPSTVTHGEAAEANLFQQMIHNCFPFWFQQPINQASAGVVNPPISQTNQPNNQARTGSSSNQVSSAGATRGSSTSQSVSGASHQSRYTDSTIPTSASTSS